MLSTACSCHLRAGKHAERDARAIQPGRRPADAGRRKYLCWNWERARSKPLAVYTPAVARLLWLWGLTDTLCASRGTSSERCPTDVECCSAAALVRLPWPPRRIMSPDEGARQKLPLHRLCNQARKPDPWFLPAAAATAAQFGGVLLCSLAGRQRMKLRL